MSKISSFDLNIVLKLNHYFSQHGGFLNKFFAEYLIYFLPVILLVLWFWSAFTKAEADKSASSQKAALRALFSVILAWPILSAIIGRLVNRPRPFDVAGINELIFHRPDFSFPSDHAAALFAVTFSFWLSGYKKLSYLILVIAIVVSFYRVATGVHFPTDILGGLGVGLISAFMIYILDKYLDKIYNFIIKIAKIIKLA